MPATGQSPTATLEMGKEVERRLNAGESHNYEVQLGKNRFFYAELIQKGIDIIITAYGPQGEKIADFDSPNGQNGPEPILLRAQEAGRYRLEVKPLNEENGPGDYSLAIRKLEKLASTPEGKVDQLFAPWDRPGSPGAAVAVVQNGSILFSKGYGSANLEYDIPNGPSTVFHIASVSKQVTAFAIAILADQGKLSLDDDIRKYLPEIPDFGEKITIRHLVHHTSGLRDQWNLLALAGWRLDDVITKEQILKLMSRQQALNFKPGEEFLYCNTGYTLMAEIVARVTGQSFPEWTQEHIFRLLGMNNTLFYDDHEKLVKNRAYSYYSSPEGFKKSVLSYANVGATSLFTTVEDLSKWALNFETMAVGNPAVMAQMHEQGVLNNGEKIGYAFGQGIGEYKGLRQVSHGGGDAGYRTYLGRFPDQRFSVVVFSNLASFNPGGMAMQVADICLEGHLKEDKPSSREDLPESSSSVAVSEAILESYTGQYQIGPGFIVSITHEGGQLRAQATGQPQITLAAVSESEFYAQEAQATLIFRKNDKGEVHQAILKQGGQELTLPRLPDFDTKTVRLDDYTGSFYSPELQTAYTLVVEEGKLLARHQRHPDVELEPIKADEFTGSAWFFGQANFIRDGNNHISGFKVSNGRVRNLLFEKGM